MGNLSLYKEAGFAITVENGSKQSFNEQEAIFGTCPTRTSGASWARRHEGVRGEDQDDSVGKAPFGGVPPKGA